MTARTFSLLGILIDGLKDAAKAAGAKPNLAWHLGVTPSTVRSPFKYSLESVAVVCDRWISAQVKASALTERRYKPLFQPAVRACFTGDECPQRRNNAPLVGLAGNRTAAQRKPARGPPDRARRAD